MCILWLICKTTLSIRNIFTINSCCKNIINYYISNFQEKWEIIYIQKDDERLIRFFCQRLIEIDAVYNTHWKI